VRNPLPSSSTTSHQPVGTAGVPPRTVAPGVAARPTASVHVAAPGGVALPSVSASAGPVAAGPASIAAAKAAAALRASNQAKAAAAAAAIRASARDHRPSPKKRGSPDVTMATASTASSSSSAKGGENTGRWTAEEHRLFLQGLEQHGKGWKKIASLIKSRTVVQIRTHAQKYFQKLAKARQNGEEGEIAMDGRGPGGLHGGGLGHHGMGGPGGAGSKRRRQSSGTKRRAISSVVASAQREVKKRQKREAGGAAAATSTTATVTTTTGSAAPSTASTSASTTPSSSPPPPHMPVAPALAPFVANPLPAPGTLPTPSASAAAAAAGASNIPSGGSITTPHGTISTSALEDTLFRFLTPTEGVSVYVPAPAAALAHPGAPHLNDVARKAGANPITVPGAGVGPTSASASVPILGGDISPTGVTDVWTESRDVPSWYASGQDVDELLQEADALDWLSDTGDLHETYAPPPPFAGVINSAHLRKAGTVPRAEPSSEDITKEVMPPMPSASQMFSTGADEEDIDGTVKISIDSSQAPATAAIGHAESDLDDPIESSLKTAPAIEPASSTASLFASATEAADATHGAQADPHLDVDVFDAHLDEQAFVSALLDNDHSNEEESFPAIH